MVDPLYTWGLNSHNEKRERFVLSLFINFYLEFKPSVIAFETYPGVGI